MMTALWLLSVSLVAAKEPMFKTPSGNPEIVVKGKTKKELVDALADYAKSAGATVSRKSDDSLEVEKVLQVVSNSQGFGRQMLRRNYKMIDSENGVRIVCSAKTFKLVSGMESNENDVTQGEGGKKCLETLADF